MPENEPKAPAEVGYLLDGHQRVSVIYGVFALSDDQAARLRGPERLFLVYFDLEKEEFVHQRFPEEHHLPARYLLSQDDRLTRWLDERRDKTKPSTPERESWDLWRRRAQQLQTTFAQYRLPYLDVTGADLEEAVNVFVRVNQQGSAVKRAEVFAALTWDERGFDFAKEARDLLEDHPRYKNFGIEPVLRSLLAALGESLYASNWEKVLETHRARLPGAMQEVRGAFATALEFLNSRFGAASGKVVPYSLHIVLLTEFFRCCRGPVKAAAAAELERWFWASSFSSGYASGGLLRFNDAVEAARRLAVGDDVSLMRERPRLQPFPRKFHAKSARVRVFHLFLKTREPRDLKTGEIISRELLLLEGMADARSVASGDQRVWRLASRLLTGASQGRGMLLPSLKSHIERVYASLVPDPRSLSILESHIVRKEAAEALMRDDLDGFLEVRERDLIRAEQEFARQYVDLPLPGEESEEEAEIDVEDESEPDF